MHWVGVGIQLVGTLLAIFALVRELLDRPAVDDAAGRSRRREVPNPWRLPLKSRPRRVLDHERRRYLNDPIFQRGPHPDVAALAGFLVDAAVESRLNAAKDWEEQRKTDEALAEANRATDRRQVQLLREQYARTRVRVIIEMVGLVLVAIGTVIS